MNLNNDISRCDGRIDKVDGEEILHHECWHCLRRIAPRPDFVWMIEPTKENECANLI